MENLFEEEYESSFQGGYFNDDGTSINEEDIPLPDLCMLCRTYHQHNPFEDIVCNLTRFDLLDGKEFVCYGFRKF